MWLDINLKLKDLKSNLKFKCAVVVVPEAAPEATWLDINLKLKN